MSTTSNEYLPYVDRIAALPLPKCVMTFGGVTLETEIPGYRTLYASGRDSLSAEMNELEGVITDGSTHRWRHIGPRDIQVGYAVVCDTPEQYHKAMNKLKGILFAKGAENVKVIFGDEPDVYFIGHVSEMPADKVADARSGGGTITIHCPKPWKYSTTEVEKTPINGVIELDYNGTYPAFPVFETTANSNLGYVSFSKALSIGGASLSTKVIQIGNPEEAGTSQSQLNTLIDDNFETERPSGWTDNGAYSPSQPVDSHTHSHVGEVRISGSGIGCYGNAAGYGTGTQFHGPTITKTLSTAAKNFQCYFHNLITTNTVGDCGCFVASIEAGSGNSRSNIASMWFIKASPSYNTGWIELVIKDKSVKKVNIPSFAYNNTITGYPKGAAWYDTASVPESARSTNTAGGAFYITKLGSKIQFTVAGTIYEFTESSLADTQATEISFWFEKWGNETPPIGAMVLHSVKFVEIVGDSIPATTVAEVVNQFVSGDKIVADVGSGSITVNGTPKYGLGAMGNDWEEFTLDPGPNAISCNYSSWSTAPEIKMKYREVYL